MRATTSNCMDHLGEFISCQFQDGRIMVIKISEVGEDTIHLEKAMSDSYLSEIDFHATMALACSFRIPPKYVLDYIVSRADDRVFRHEPLDILSNKNAHPFTAIALTVALMHRYSMQSDLANIYGKPANVHVSQMNAFDSI